jgi:universal stress protein A
MKQFKKILCPYDFSDYAREAVKYALVLANERTQLTLLHIVQLPYATTPEGFIVYDIKTEEVRKMSEEEARAEMADWQKQYPGVQLELEVIADQDPAEVILDRQRKGDYDLIVMGSHGRRGLQRLLMGSVAESVMRAAACPVLIVKRS